MSRCELCPDTVCIDLKRGQRKMIVGKKESIEDENIIDCPIREIKEDWEDTQNWFETIGKIDTKHLGS